MYKHLLAFLDRHKILSDTQFGFRKNHSTSYALTKLYDKISCAIDNREITVGVFIDLSKAFDTVDHNILLEKLEHYGIRGLALNWFRSYLSNRQQYVEFNGLCSSRQRIIGATYRKGQFWALFYFGYTLMTYVMCQMF